MYGSLGSTTDDCAKSGTGKGNTIKTPYGDAVQSDSQEAAQIRDYVNGGGRLYKTGELMESNAANSQFWSPTNPLTNPNYADSYGLAKSNVDFVIGGTSNPGTPFITRIAPPVPPNLGGGIEIVTNPNGVNITFFYMP
jgi:hypothetical protein